MAVRQRNRSVFVSLVLPLLIAACAAPQWDEDGQWDEEGMAEEWELTDGDAPMAVPPAGCCDDTGDCGCTEEQCEVIMRCPYQPGEGDGGCELEVTLELPPPPAPIVDSMPPVNNERSAASTGDHGLPPVPAPPVMSPPRAVAVVTPSPSPSRSPQPVPSPIVRAAARPAVEPEQPRAQAVLALPALPPSSKRHLSQAERIERDLQARLTPPPADMLAAADYGEVPTAWRWSVRHELERFVDGLDAASVTTSRPTKGWLRADAASPFVYAWRVRALVRTRSESGGYSGWQEYSFFFRGEDVFAVDTPSALVWTHSHAAMPTR